MRLGALLASLAVIPIVTGCTSSPKAATPSPYPGVDMRLTLAQLSADGGTPLHGTMTVENNTGKAIGINCGTWFGVGLTNADVGYQFPQLDVRCVDGKQLQPGTTTYPVTIQTTFGSCVQPPYSPTSARPRCPEIIPGAEFVPPPLPPGTYETKVDAALPGIAVRVPAPINVTVRD